MTAAISAIGRWGMPRYTIHATIGAVIVNVTTNTEQLWQLPEGLRVAQLARSPEVDEVADREADAHRCAHLEEMQREAAKPAASRRLR